VVMGREGEVSGCGQGRLILSRIGGWEVLHWTGLDGRKKMSLLVVRWDGRLLVLGAVNDLMKVVRCIFNMD
jgi:hypothetical protein